MPLLSTEMLSGTSKPSVNLGQNQGTWIKALPKSFICILQALWVCKICLYIVLDFLGKKEEIENIYLFPLNVKWEKGPTSNSTLLVTFVFKPAVENDTVEYVSVLYHHHNQMTQKEKEK